MASKPGPMTKIAQLCLALCLICSIWACESTDNPQPENNQLVGKWKLESISGGFSGAGYKANWNNIDVKNDLTYRRFNGDTLKFSSTYKFQTKDGKEHVIFAEKEGDKINQIFESQPKTFKLEKGRLILEDPCCDLFLYEFSKVNN
jgi:hypothetical protein